MVAHGRITKCCKARWGAWSGGKATRRAEFILSCNHVLANEDAASEDDPILEPSPGDGGNGSDPIAFLQAWIELNASGNLVDCAIARPTQPGVFDPKLRGLGRPASEIMAPAREQTVKKSGRNPPHVTLGVVTDVTADIMVPYKRGALGFVQQIAIKGVGGTFAEPGDSGSLVVDAQSLRPVGLLFAGSSTVSFANPITRVFTYLKIAMT